MMTNTDLTNALTAVYRDASAVAFFNDKATGWRRFFVSQFDGRFVIEDSATLDRHSLDSTTTTFERLVAHVAGFIGHNLTAATVDRQPEITVSDAWSAIHAKWGAR